MLGERKSRRYNAVRSKYSLIFCVVSLVLFRMMANGAELHIVYNYVRRKYKDGKGSFEQIISALELLNNKCADIHTVIRINVDKNNLDEVSTLLEYLGINGKGLTSLTILFQGILWCNLKFFCYVKQIFRGQENILPVDAALSALGTVECKCIIGTEFCVS